MSVITQFGTEPLVKLSLKGVTLDELEQCLDLDTVVQQYEYDDSNERLRLSGGIPFHHLPFSHFQGHAQTEEVDIYTTYVSPENTPGNFETFVYLYDQKRKATFPLPLRELGFVDGKRKGGISLQDAVTIFRSVPVENLLVDLNCCLGFTDVFKFNLPITKMDSGGQFGYVYCFNNLSKRSISALKQVWGLDDWETNFQEARYHSFVSSALAYFKRGDEFILPNPMCARTETCPEGCSIYDTCTFSTSDEILNSDRGCARLDVVVSDEERAGYERISLNERGGVYLANYAVFMKRDVFEKNLDWDWLPLTIPVDKDHLLVREQKTM
ncbi:hypothetical protein HN592_06115 [Candidatus Woesearchaeota archaeon]|nr:hypothetical protein [Candidatus Woesearchaeota archaeon]MBT3304829.1 hypothetical protein [Candidatus Woesearchaeota archaeon]MBT4367835.1 hypothetical protein [Candidatus Woesearchaeota archaeon]MBT4712323.1 hypothetical protein [Candidatus Woesearchaeota archaeon]MBT6639235.1 hypothetical protein [Candidatus Woesearchaeota archaeon]